MTTSPVKAASAVDKAVTVLHNAIDDAAHKAHTASNQAASAGNQAAEWVSKCGQELTAKPKRLIEEASGYVSAHPLKSLGIAIIAALAVGRLMR
jgi:ElaB/YqjD/DUF883 family membrane-anchored ribosome-binding protein